MRKKTPTRRAIQHHRRRTTGDSQRPSEAQIQKWNTEAAIGFIELAMECLKRIVQSE